MMSHGSPKPVRRSRSWITALCLAACVLGLYVLLTPATELVRFRNSLLASVGTDTDFHWTPEHTPSEYLIETASAPSEIAAAAKLIQQRAGDDRLMLGIVEHLRSKPKRKGPIKSTTVAAYGEITRNGRGYCADYTQVFNGLSHALNLPVREWGMSFDSFSGDGHAFNEVWDQSLSQWTFVDSFHGFYVRDRGSNRPLSALEFRDRVASVDGFDSVLITPIGGTFRFDSPREAYDYYVRGADQFYLWFGNHVFTYDNDPLVRTLSRASRSIEQLGAILSGVHPKIRIFPTATNQTSVERLTRLRWQVLILVALSLLLSGVLARQLYVLRKVDSNES